MSTVTLNPNVRVDPPASLPVDYLSLSSIKAFMKCPEAWRRKYIEREYEPPSGKMILGSAAHAALAQHYSEQIDCGEGICTEELLDEFSAEWEERTSREEVDYGSETPGQMKDSGAGALTVYHHLIAPAVVPVAVEREFTLSWPGVSFRLTGFIDLEDADQMVRDSKMVGRRMSRADADADLQSDVLLAARRAEGNRAAGFLFDTMIRTKTPSAEIVPTERTEHQLDLLTDRIFAITREIEWRCETGIWAGAPPHTWFCSTCGYADCAFRLGAMR